MKNATDITIILDRSGSMASIADDTIGGFNSFIEDQRREPSPATVSLVQFDDKYEPNYEGVALSDVAPLTRETFVPRGWTALNDAVGRTVIATGERLAAMPESDRPNKVVCVIITDGQENRSTEYSSERVRHLVEEQTSKYGWLFVYLGANVNAFAESAKLGISVANAANYMANAGGVRAAYHVASTSLRSVRSGSRSVMDSFINDAERNVIDKAGGVS